MQSMPNYTGTFSRLIYYQSTSVIAILHYCFLSKVLWDTPCFIQKQRKFNAIATGHPV